MIVPDIALPCTVQTYPKVPAALKVRANVPALCVGDEVPVENVTLCPTAPVAQVQVTVVPTGTVVLEGVNELFATVIALLVLPPGVPVGPPPDTPPPPQPAVSAAIATHAAPTS